MSGDGVAVDGECGNGARLEYCHGCRRSDDGVAVDGARSIAMVAGGQVMELR